MTSSVPWSVKGIDAKARETAKELARRSGMTLGEWLNERIRQEGGTLVEDSANSVSRALEDLTGRIESAEQRSTLAVTGIDQSVRGVLARIDMAEREQTAVGARFEGALRETQDLQSAIDARLRKLESEAAGPRSAEALKSLEAALGRVANHLYEGESRTREALSDIRRDVGRLTERVEKGGGDAGADAIQRLEAAEARVGETIRVLDQRLTDLSRRVEQGGSGDIDKKLEAMAANLARGLQGARAEMAKHLRDAIEGNSERLDQAMLDLTTHVQAAERRSAEALERMGQEVLRVADVLNRRVQGVETRSVSALQTIGGEVVRAVDAMEAKTGKFEAAQAETAEKLTGEIGRIAERLSDRIATAERRASQAVDDVNDKLALAAERINQRHERASGDLAERIRVSEERTQRLLEEARDRIDRRMTETLRAQAAAPPAVTTRVSYEPSSFADTLDAPAFPDSPSFPGTQAEASGAASRVLYPDAAPFGHTYAPKGFTPVEPEFDDADIEAAQDFASPLTPESEADFVDADLEAAPQTYSPPEPEIEPEPLQAYQPPPPAPPQAHAEIAPQRDPFADPIRLDQAPPPAPSIAPRILTTKELVEQARAAARAASEENRAKKTKPEKRRAPVQETAPLGAIRFGERKKDNGAKIAMFAVFGGALVLMGGAGVAWLMTPTGQEFAGDINSAWNNEHAPDAGAAPRAAVALDPKPIDPNAPPPAAIPPVTDPASVALYKDGSARIRAKDNTGLELIRRAANLGHPQAQFDLGRFYEEGEVGLAKTLPEARRWFERAASSGNTKAMHSLALMYYQGSGGPQNLTSAAEWFKRAAELGFADSQYNIGRLYEDGIGVKENDAEAYKWYLLASRSGSPEQVIEAKTAAERVRAGLPAEARATAERVAATFTTRTPVQLSAAGDVDLTSVQKALNRLGYYKGEANGAPSASLRAAVVDFQRDQGLAQTGQVDADTAMRLAPYMK